MAETIEDITLNYEEDGQLLVQELDKEVLSRGAWTTILFRYRQWDRKKEEFGPDLFSIRRYRKLKGSYIPQSKFNISSRAQAEKIVAALTGWLKQ